MNVLAGAVLFLGLLGLYNCGKCETPQKPPAPPTTETPATPTVATMLQTTCPVLGGPINKNIFVEYKGKKVYFCCEDCKATFAKDPEKYVKDLPQFKQ